ncbi:YfhO family protein [uncultured Vagococcus sp.]|uniref:YfhO family protein n=1 Tax=uncultured Vagococcus sp. TaxID=189676 RepID=UPI0028D3DFB2|nr:YfhO family protein [uncultured Vagococcus sp.]
MKTKSTKEVLWLSTLLILIAIMSIVPFVFKNSIHSQDDLIFHKERLENYYLSIRQLDFFPKVFPTMAGGYGYGADLFYPSFFLLPFAIFRLIGSPFVQSYYLFQFFLSLMTAISAFYAFKRLTTPRAAYLGTLLYTLSTYRLIDQSVRGALGETLAFIFLPLVLLGLYEICLGNYQKWWLLSFGMAGVLSCHLITAFYTAIIVIMIFFGALLTNQTYLTDKVKAMLFAIVLGGLLTAWVTLPMFEQLLSLKFNLANASLGQNALNYQLGQLLTNSISTVTEPWSKLSPNIGISLVIVLVLSMMTWKKSRTITKVVALTTLTLFVLSSNLFPWSLLKDSIFATIQFPWRLLIFVSLAAGLLAAQLAMEHPNIQTTFSLGIITALIFLITLGFNSHVLNQVSVMGFTPMTNDNYLSQRHADIGYGQEYLLQGSNYTELKEAPHKYVTIDGQPWFDFNQQLIHQQYKTVRIDLPDKAISTKDMVLSVPLFYYIGYKVSTEQGIFLDPYNQNGLVTFVAPGNTNALFITYEGTFIQRLSLIISWMTLLFAPLLLKHKLNTAKARS